MYSDYFRLSGSDKMGQFSDFVSNAVYVDLENFKVFWSEGSRRVIVNRGGRVRGE